MSYAVHLTHSAVADLNDIVDWIASNDTPERAMHVLDAIRDRIASLRQQPQRGAVPPELRGLGVDRCREIFFKPYRIIYHIRGRRVVVNLIADGRRDMAALLQRRLTAAT